MLLFYDVVGEGFITPELEVDAAGATKVLEQINRQTLGQLIRNTRRHSAELEKLEPLLSEALDARNRLSHHFYRLHNFRKNSVEGRQLMLNDLETMHSILLGAYTALVRLSGIDLDAEAKKHAAFQKPGDEEPTLFHVSI